MFRRISFYIFGNPDEIGFDNYLVQMLCFLIGIIGSLGTTIDIILGFSIYTIIFTLLPTLIFFSIYLYSKWKKKYLLSKYALIIISLIVINIQWPLNYGSSGPVLYLFVVVQSFVIIFFRKWEKFIFTLAIFINVSLLFLIEYYYRDVFGHYETELARLVDVYWGMLIDLSLCIVLLSIALGFYKKEKEKAQRADNLKSSFLANMSHEIRTPMNAIVGFSQLLRDSEISDTQKKYAEIISDNSYHLLKLIDDIIDISKIEANQIQITKEDFSLRELFESTKPVIQQFLKKYRKEHIQLMIDYPSENLYIHSDYTRIKQVLTNLLSNAVKFTQEGKINLGFSPGDHSVQIFVSDSGVGIPAEYLDEIFDRFRKLDNIANEKIYRGTGIGLSISKQIIQLLGGTIWAESEKGKGAKFCFTIPSELIHKPLGSTAKISNTFLPEFSGNQLLVVEDEDNNYEFLFEILQEYKFEILRAKNGIEAIKIYKENPKITLVLMDIKMPIMDGLEATRQLKKLNPDIKIIAQTAYAMPKDEKESQLAGCDEYISKPINTNLLIEKIQNLLFE